MSIIKKPQKKWTRVEVDFLINNYNNYESYILAEKLKRSKESVYNKLWRLRKRGILKQDKNISNCHKLAAKDLGRLGEYFSKKYFERKGYRLCKIPLEVNEESNYLRLKRGDWKNDPHGTDFDFAMEKEDKIYLVEVKTNTSKLQSLQKELIEIFKKQYIVFCCQIKIDIQKLKDIIKEVHQSSQPFMFYIIREPDGKAKIIWQMADKYESELVKEIKIKEY